MLQNEGFKLFFSEIYFCLRDLGLQNSVKHLGPLGTALPHPRLLRHCGDHSIIWHSVCSEDDLWSVWPQIGGRSKLTGYIGRVLGNICLKNLSVVPFLQVPHKYWPETLLVLPLLTSHPFTSGRRSNEIDKDPIPENLFSFLERFWALIDVLRKLFLYKNSTTSNTCKNRL